MKNFLAGLFAAVFAFLFLSCSAKFQPKNSALGVNGENFIALNKAAVRAKISNAEKNRYMFFKFTENQKAHLENLRQKNFGASLCIKIKFSRPADFKTSEKEFPFAFGFLFDEDLHKNDAVADSFLTRKFITGNFGDCTREEFSVLFSVAQNTKLPCGFFFYGTMPFEISGAELSEAKIGWENEDEKIPLFAFGPSGGSVRWNFSSADFSDAKNIFPDINLPGRIMPKVEVKIFSAEKAESQKTQTRINFKIGKEKISVRLVQGDNEKIFQSSAFDDGIEKIEILDHAENVKKIIMKPNEFFLSRDKNQGKVLFPLKTDLGLVMNWPKKNWRRSDYEIFEWELFKGVIFFDFENYKIQNSFFTRLAFFAEKAGYKGTLVSDDFVENQHGYNAHDYKAQDLADFFSLADAENFPLNDYENLLKEILLANKIILKEKNSNRYKAGNGAVISFSRESPEYLRYTFLAHESWHGIFFTDENFRNLTATCFSLFDEESMEFLQKFWETQPGLGYDRNDEYLMHNEFMAYLMQQPFSNVRQYFLQVANRGSVNRIQPSGAKYIREIQAQPFVEAAKIFDDYAFEKWGLGCGRVSTVFRN